MSVLLDYHLIDVLVMIILGLVLIVLMRCTPKRLFVHEDDPRYHYPRPYRNGTAKGMLIVSIALPEVLYLIIFLYKPDLKILPIIAKHIGSCLVTGIVCNIIKICVGRERPYFFTVMPEDSAAETCCPDEIPYEEFKKMFKSFPSAIVAVITCSLVYCISITNNIFHYDQFWVLAVICFLLFPLIPAIVNITRSFHNHFDDVGCGMVIGLIIAVVASQ